MAAFPCTCCAPGHECGRCNLPPPPAAQGAVLIDCGDGSVRIIKTARTGTDGPLTADERAMLHLAERVRALEAERETMRATLEEVQTMLICYREAFPRRGPGIEERAMRRVNSKRRLATLTPGSTPHA